MINRSDYLEKIKRWKDKEIIKVLTGVRRCGKSTLLTLYKEQLVKEGASETQIQFYNFEDLALADSLDYLTFYQKVEKKLVPDRMNYLFLDEIQQLQDFEKLVDSLFVKKNVDIYITGSNAYMLSGELATLLSGRYVEIHVLPLSFKEMMAESHENPQTAFQHYRQTGGFPFLQQLTDESDSRDYLSGLINTVLVKDVLSRRQRSDSLLVEQLAKFLIDSSGGLVTIKKIADSLTSLGQKTSSDTVASYVTAFQEAFLFYKCDRYDIAGKRYLTINSKYFPVDTGLRLALLGNKRPNLGSQLEGIVYIELLRRGYQVFVGEIAGKEVDFVAVKNGVTEYYQVSVTLKDEKTYAREVASPKAIADNYRKILLTEDLGSYNDDGVEQMNVLDWLLGKVS